MSEPRAPAPAGTVTVATVACTPHSTHMIRIQAAWNPTSTHPSVSLAGLPDDAASATRDRLRAAILTSGLRWPTTPPVTVRVLPHDLPAADPGLDLAFALALLTLGGQIPSGVLAEAVCLGVLGPDGSIRPVEQLPLRTVLAEQAAFRRLIRAGRRSRSAICDRTGRPPGSPGACGRSSTGSGPPTLPCPGNRS